MNSCCQALSAGGSAARAVAGCLLHSRHSLSVSRSAVWVQRWQGPVVVWVRDQVVQGRHSQPRRRVAPQARQLMQESSGGLAPWWQRAHSPAL